MPDVIGLVGSLTLVFAGPITLFAIAASRPF